MSQTKAQLFDVSVEGPTALKNGAFDVTLGAGGNVTISDGNLVVAAGHGIDFSADANAAGMTSELLDDYEEGTFTPGYEGSSTAGSFTYSTQLGYYTRIGRQVFVEIILTNITEVSAGSGTLRVTGLPFSNTESHSVGSVRFDGFNFAAGTNYVVPVRGGDTFIQFQEVKSGGSDTAMNVTDRVNNTSDLFLSFTYTVD
jgi:hypothetical protein